MTSPNDPISFQSVDETVFRVPQPKCFIFNDDGKEIGRLSWADGVFRFEGNADASARIFFQALKEMT